MNCHYRIVYYPKDTKHFYGYFMEIDVNVTESFSATLTNLRVGTDYKGTVQSYYRRTEPAIGSKELRFTFATDSANLDSNLSHSKIVRKRKLNYVVCPVYLRHPQSYPSKTITAVQCTYFNISFSGLYTDTNLYRFEMVFFYLIRYLKLFIFFTQFNRGH